MNPAWGRAGGTHLLQSGLRLRREQFQVVVLQEQTDNHGHFVGSEVYAQAFVHPAAKADEGKAVLAIFRPLWRKAPGIIVRGLVKDRGEPMRQMRRDEGQPTRRHLVASYLIGGDGKAHEQARSRTEAFRLAQGPEQVREVAQRFQSDGLAWRQDLRLLLHHHAEVRGVLQQVDLAPTRLS